MKRSILVLLCLTALAAEAQTIATKLDKSKNFQMANLLPDGVSYFSIFSGPSVGDFSDPVNENGEVKQDSINTWNQVSFQWRLSKETSFVFNPRFVINNNASSDEEMFEYVSPVMGFNTTWYKNGKFRFSGSLNTITPLSRQESHMEEGLIFNPGGFNQISYELNNKVNLSMWLWGRAQIYNKATTDKSDRFSYFYAPKVTYSFSDSNQLSTFYQINGQLDNDYENETFKDDSFNIMYSYTINKYLTVEPIITMYRETSFDISKSNINVWLSGRLF